ncbi:putative Ig domain-containing protein [uncultured Cardiobacterium sp.]|uniref:putative Ig domain-containing protein n=1 Tax=uncultured Cardiobacterium sp. TaxID=417619 RepID=UPI00262B07A2|nr:putative Ig domain-containing protein [uncultured Cardiobacterium sp.]
MSEEYLKYSARFLDKSHIYFNVENTIIYRDLTSGKENIHLAKQDESVIYDIKEIAGNHFSWVRAVIIAMGKKNKEAQQVIFGTDDADNQASLQGGNLSGDHIFGGGGNDILDGKEGDDYLEGGKDFDTYIINGHDVVLDTDNQGETFFSDRVAENRVRYFVYDKASNEWHSSNELGNKDGKYIAKRDSSSNALIITETGNNNSVTIKDYFRNGNDKLDGSLDLKEVEEDKIKVKWDLDHSNKSVIYSYDAGGASAGVHVHGSNLRSSAFAGSRYDDTFATGEGVLHYINTAAGNDTVIGGTGREYIRAGFNRYMPPDEEGNSGDDDIIYGGGNTDIIAGGGGKDTLWAGEMDEDYKTPVSFDKGDWRGDWISGQHNDDTIHGSNKDDLLFGGGGKDTISAGAGDDIVLGDANYFPSFYSTMIEGQEVNWKSNNTYSAGVGIPSHNNFEWEKTDIGTQPDKERVFLDFGRTRIILKNGIRLNSNDSVQVDEKGSYDDIIDGGAGNDWIDGQLGNDIITGGPGRDYMRGGEGEDSYLFTREDLRPEKDGDTVLIDTVDDDGTGNINTPGGFHDGIYLDGRNMAGMRWMRDGDENIWNTADGWRITYTNSILQISHKDEVGKINVLNFADGDYGLHLPENPQPPEANNPPQVGKAIPAQTVNEKSQLQFTLSADAFNDPDNDDLRYTATLSNGNMLPKWLHFDAAKHTFSGTPGNDDVGNLSIRVTATDGRGGSAAQNFALEVVNVNDAPQIGATLANQQGTGGKPWQYRLPANAFRDIDKDDVLTLSAKLDNGQPLPSWLKFDGKTGQFSATLPKEAKASAYRIAVTATDKAGAQAKQVFNLDITPPANIAPQAATTIVAQKVNEKSRWQFTLPANAFRDPDGDTLSYTATLADGKALPEWLHFDAARQTFSGTPGNDDVGNFSIRVTATDGRGGSAAQNFALEVVNVNDAPQIGATLANQQGTGGKPWQYRLPTNAFRDIDKGDMLILSAKLDNGQPLPSWLKFDGKTGQFSATLPKEAKASAYRIAVTATDKAGAQAKQAFNLDITPPANTAPQAATTITAQKANEKSRWQFTLPANAFRDPDGDTLTYTASLVDGKALPKWLYFDAAKRTFSGTPGNDDVGNLSIRVTANDGRGGSAAQNFALEVVNVNDAPQIGATLANQQGTGDKPWQYRLPTNAFRDIDKGDVLTLSAKLDNGQPLPSWLKFDGKTGQFSGTLPSSEQASAYRIAVTATDKAGVQARQAFNLMIAAVPLNRIQGTAGIDKLQGTDGADYISGHAGNDRLEGKDGNDIIEGGLDNDSLVGGKGDDIYRFSGQFGNDGIHNFDIANYDSRTDRCDIIEFTDRKRSDVTIMRIGNNLLLRTQDGQSVSVYDNFSNKGKNSHYINFIRFSDMTLSADDIKAILQNGTSGDDHLYAKPEGSVLYAGAGNDTIIGNIGNDNLFGEDGNDTLRGNAGDDYLRGEDGNDALYGDAGKDYLDGGNGNDKLYGGADNDRLFGDRGNDVLFGGDGDDTLDGSDGDDLLYGEAGNDELFGSSGNDVLNGGTGNDKLSGYEGNDVYQFNGNFGQDIIQNKNNQNMLFGSQYDRIDFTDLQQQDLIFRRSGNNLLLVSKKHANNQVTVLDHFRDNGKTAARIDEIRFADGSRLDYDAVNRLVQQPTGNLPRANLVQDRYAANAARQAQMLTQAMAASGAQPLDNLMMTPDNPPLMPTPLSNLKP